MGNKPSKSKPKVKKFILDNFDNEKSWELITEENDQIFDYENEHRQISAKADVTEDIFQNSSLCKEHFHGPSTFVNQTNCNHLYGEVSCELYQVQVRESEVIETEETQSESSDVAEVENEYAANGQNTILKSRTNFINCAVNAKKLYIGSFTNVNTTDDDLERSILASTTKQNDEINKIKAVLQNRYSRPEFGFLSNQFLNIDVDNCLDLYFQELKLSADNTMNIQEPTLMTPDTFGKILGGSSSKGRIHTVLIEGPSGIGKSIFCHQLSRCWANEHSDALNWFTFLFYIHNSFNQALKNDLLQLMKGCEIDDDELYSIINKEKKVLILLDDAMLSTDEYMKKEVDLLIDKKHFTNATVVIVCQNPHNLDARLFQKYFRIIGFAPNQIEQIVNNFEVKTCLKLMQIISPYEFSLNTLRNPFLVQSLFHVASNAIELQFSPNLSKMMKQIYKLMITAPVQNSIMPSCSIKRLGESCLATHESVANIDFFEKTVNTWHPNSQDVSPLLFALCTANKLLQRISSNDFENQLKLHCKVPLILPLVFGFAGKDALLVFKKLPWSIRNEIGYIITLLQENPAVDISTILKELPSWLVLTISNGFVVISSISRTKQFFSSSEISILSTFGCFLQWFPDYKRILDNVVRHPSFQLTQLTVSVVENHCPIEDVCELFTILDGNTSIQILKLSIPINSETSNLLQSLNLKGLKKLCLFVNSIDYEFEFLDDYKLSEVSQKQLWQIESFQFIVNSTNHNSKQLHYAFKLLQCCEKLKSVKMNCIANLEDLTQLADIVDKKNLQKLMFNWKGACSKELIKKTNFQQEVSQSPFYTLCNSISLKSHLTSLNLNNSNLTSIDVECLFSHLKMSTSSVESLGLGYTNKEGHNVFSVDLVEITPPMKHWKYLDFSGWTIIEPDKTKPTGTIDTLKIHTTKTVRIFRLATLFSIKKIHCDGNSVMHADSSSTANPVGICIRDIESESNFMLVKKCVGILHQLQGIKLSGCLKVFANNNAELNCYDNLKSIHFHIKMWDSMKLTPYFFELLSAIICSAHLKCLKLTVIEPVKTIEEVWQHHLGDFFNFIHKSMSCKQQFRFVLVQPIVLFPTFMDEFENWQVNCSKQFHIDDKFYHLKERVKVTLMLPTDQLNRETCR